MKPLRLLERYIVKQVLISMGVVTLALVGLQLFILLVNQIQEVGRGSYGLSVMLRVVLCQLPYQIYLFFPMASLLGVLSGLGMLASHRELIAMRAAGMSVGQISRAVLWVAGGLMLTMTLLGETVVPKLTSLAKGMKIQAIEGGNALRTSQGIWLRRHRSFIFIKHIQTPRSLEGVTMFSFNPQFQLAEVSHFERVDLVGQQWHITQGAHTYLGGERVTTQKVPHEIWPITLEPALLKLANAEADEMTLPQLYRYRQAQQDHHQNIGQISLVFWQRLMQPFSMLVMMMLGIPFIFGPLRGSGMGIKLLMGVCCGFSFYTLNHFLGSMSQVFQGSPVVAAVLPTCLFALLGGGLMKRVR